MTGDSGIVVAVPQAAFSAKSPPLKPKNRDTRPREYLTEPEVEQLIKAAREGRHGHRDATLILLMYRHGLRVSEAVSLRWDQIHLTAGLIDVERVKNGLSAVHPLSGRELRALRRLKRDSDGNPFTFVSERGAPMTSRNVRTIVKRAGERAGVDFPVHPHQLRHACGYRLINDGVDVRTVQQYLGHASISSTVIYTKLDSKRFNGLWRD
jgi:type 1 fimbriae regulatory protein FimB/type 1 fimbriae regulatory protein FimE